eukprot:Gb_40573 [translate_table: standard]
MAPSILDNPNVKTHKHNEYLYTSKLPDIHISNHPPLHTYCFERLEEFAEKPCLIDGATGKIYNYGEVELISRKVAAGLAKLGLKQGEVVMLLVQNCVEFAFVFLGSSIRGAITTTANPFYTPGEIAKQANASGARIIVTQAVYAEKLNDLKGQNLIVITIDSPPEGCQHISVMTEADVNEYPYVNIDPDDVVALPYSSGTTGLPKGVMLTHRGIVSCVAQQVDGPNPNHYLHSEDVVLCVLPLFHAYSLNSVLLCSLRVGAAILIMKKFNIGTLLELIQRFKITVAAFVPPIVLEMSRTPIVSNYDVSSVRTIMSAGAALLGKKMVDGLRTRFPKANFGQVYGMTECLVLAVSLAFAQNPFPAKIGSCGTVPQIMKGIVKLQSLALYWLAFHGSSAPNSIPPISRYLKLSSLPRSNCYLDNPEATGRTIEKEGWLHTGDVGFIDNDEEIFIVDRVKELIKYKGYQVSLFGFILNNKDELFRDMVFQPCEGHPVPPAELEAILVSHPSIADAAVVGQKNEAAGQVPVAFVVKCNGTEISEEEIKTFVAKQVVFYKKLHRVYSVRSIPKSPSGKILRQHLRARL